MQSELELDVDIEIIESMTDNETTQLDNQITQIHPDSNIFYNSINIALGKQGTGKTFYFFREILKLDKLKTHHMLIYVTNNGTNDQTYQMFKPKLSIPILIVSYDEVLETLLGLKAYKHLYNQIIDDGLIKNIDPAQREALFDALHVSNFSQRRLHTLVLYDDVAFEEQFKKHESPLNKLMFECRHINVSFMLCTQKLQGISTPVKSQATSITIFAGYPPVEIAQIHRSIQTNTDYQEFKQMLCQLEPNSCLHINIKMGSMKVINLQHINTVINRLKQKKPHPKLKNVDSIW